MWGAWVAQSVERLTLAQIMISQLTSSSSVLGSVLQLRAWSLLWILYLPLFLLPHPHPHPRSCSVSLYLKNNPPPQKKI